MTRTEAINLIGWLKSKTNRDDDLEAIDMAVEALQGDMYCPNCGVRLVQEDEYLEPTQTHRRLIDADALMRSAVEKFYITNLFNHISKMIEDAPTVPVVDITQRDLCQDISCTDCPFMQETCKLMDYVAYADRPHGEWIGLDECSVCGKQAIYFIDGVVCGIECLPNFCPNCGADMRKENK